MALGAIRVDHGSGADVPSPGLTFDRHGVVDDREHEVRRVRPPDEAIGIELDPIHGLVPRHRDVHDVLRLGRDAGTAGEGEGRQDDQGEAGHGGLQTWVGLTRGFQDAFLRESSRTSGTYVPATYLAKTAKTHSEYVCKPI